MNYWTKSQDYRAGKKAKLILNSLCKIALLIAAPLVTSCATPYYGYSKQEWQQFSEEDKQAIEAEYEEIIQFKYRQTHEDQFEERKQQVIKRGVRYE